MSSYEDYPVPIEDSAKTIGRNIAEVSRTIGATISQLDIDLISIGCDPTDDPEKLAAGQSHVLLSRSNPIFSQIVRAGARSIIFRSEHPEMVRGPQYVHVSEEELGVILKNTIEGAIWSDEDASRRRNDIARQNATILSAYVEGLGEGGCQPKKAKEMIRDEFKEILDGLWKRGSYHCFPESKVVSSIMRLSGLRNPTSRAYAVCRFVIFAKEYGIGLAITRTLPDKYLIDL